MPGESLLFLAIIFVAFILFVKEIFPLDVTALALLAILLATDLLSIEEAVSGFSNQAVLTRPNVCSELCFGENRIPRSSR